MAPKWKCDGNQSMSGRTSLIVLIEWLACVGNYARFQAEPSAACDDVLAYLKTYGIRYRNKAGVKEKVLSLQAEVAGASGYLHNNGYVGTSNFEGWIEKDKESFEKKYPNFKILPPSVISVLLPLNASDSSSAAVGSDSSALEITSSVSNTEEDDNDDEGFEILETIKIEPTSINIDRGKRALLELEYQEKRDEIDHKKRMRTHESNMSILEWTVARAKAKQDLMNTGMSEEQAEQNLRKNEQAP